MSLEALGEFQSAANCVASPKSPDSQVEWLKHRGPLATNVLLVWRWDIGVRAVTCPKSQMMNYKFEVWQIHINQIAILCHHYNHSENHKHHYKGCIFRRTNTVNTSATEWGCWETSLPSLHGGMFVTFLCTYLKVLSLFEKPLFEQRLDHNFRARTWENYWISYSTIWWGEISLRSYVLSLSLDKHFSYANHSITPSEDRWL